MGLDDHVDLRRRFDQWERSCLSDSFARVRRAPVESPAAEVDSLDAVWGDDPILRADRGWLR